MELRQLEYVVGVVDHAGFTRAAAALFVSQPALSQGVRALEAELGIDLFVRAGRHVSLTPAGEAFLGPARQALRDTVTARAAVDDVAGLSSGHLDIVCLPTLAVDPVAALIGRFRSAHGSVAVRLAEPDDPAAIVSLVQSGAAEIGCTDVVPDGSGLEVVELEPQRYMAVLPPGSSGLPTGAIRLGALAALPLITTPAGTSTRRLLDDALASAGVGAEFAVETDHREAITELVLAGAGAAILPASMAGTAAERGAEIREVRPLIVRRVLLVHRPGTLAPAGRAFVALAGGSVGPGSA